MLFEPLRIAGERVDTGRRAQILSPFDGQVVGHVGVGRKEEMERAIAAAHAHAKDAARLPRHARAAVLEGVARRLEEHADEFARRIVAEGGKPRRFARMEVARAVITFKLAAGEALRTGGEVMPADLEPRGEGRLCLYERVARGAVGAIAPFNFPLNLVAHKVAPAIAAGCPVVLKPPPQCPLTAFALASLLEEAGLPPWMLSVIDCPADVAQRLAEDPRIAVLSFTGSAEVGWKLKSLAGKKQVILELGGNAPCVVDEGADAVALAPLLATASFAQGGQVCIKIQRLIVHSSLYDEFVAAFTAAAAALPCGDPAREDVVVGPLIERRHVDRVLSWIDEAVAAGATKLSGGERNGSIVTPAVLENVPADAKASCEEVFGPVVTLERFDDFGDAIERCNATRYGLQVGVFTRDVSRALRAFRELDYGGVMINEAPAFRLDNFPYGGTKDSGFGREGVRFAVEEMTEPKVLMLRAT